MHEWHVPALYVPRPICTMPYMYHALYVPRPICTTLYYVAFSRKCYLVINIP